jgi:hypothetical protein
MLHWWSIQVDRCLRRKEWQSVWNAFHYTKSPETRVMWLSNEIAQTTGISRALGFRIRAEDVQGPLVSWEKKGERKYATRNGKEVKYSD